MLRCEGYADLLSRELEFKVWSRANVTLCLHDQSRVTIVRSQIHSSLRELTRTDRKASSDWLLLSDQILTIIYDDVTFGEINNKIEYLRNKDKLENV